MKKFEISWSERHRVVIEAEDMDEAFCKLNDGGEDLSELVLSTDYDCKEVQDA